MRDLTQPTPSVVAFRNGVPVGVVLSALALLAFTGLALADPPAAKAPQVEDKDKPELQPGAGDKPVLTIDELTEFGAASLVMDGFPKGTEGFSELALLSAGEYRRYWTFYDPNVVRSIPASLLGFVTDDTPITHEIADPEQDAYFTMMIFANRTSPEAMDKAARPDADYTHVFNEPRQYRGDIVHFDGKLKKLVEFEPQPMAAQGGVQHYYEGFMYADPYEKYPIFFIITELPKGLKPANRMDVKVGFSGYFFKKFRYKAGDTDTTKKDRLAPLFIGHTIKPVIDPAPEEAPPEQAWVAWLGPTFFGVIGVTVAVLFGLGFWFRRGDSRVRGRVYAARYNEFVGPPAEEPENPKQAEGGAAPRNRLDAPGDLPKSEP